MQFIEFAPLLSNMNENTKVDGEDCSNKTKDDVDTKFFSTKTKEIASTETATQQDIYPLVDVYAKNYKMNHAKRGRAIIFNHYVFDDPKMGRRDGTSLDCINLKKTLEHYGFEISVHTDLKYGKIYDVLNRAAEENHSDSDCILIAVLSHGDEGRLHAKDVKYKPETLWTPFRGDNCNSLLGKPKIFIIQACRGDNVDSGVKVMTDSTSTYTIPNMADILVMYSSFDGYYSFRSSSSGSWFIQSLCAELMEPENYGTDILQILTFVNRRIAIDYKSNVPHHRDLDKKKQVGSIVSSFTKILYLTPRK